MLESLLGVPGLTWSPFYCDQGFIRGAITVNNFPPKSDQKQFTLHYQLLYFQAKKWPEKRKKYQPGEMHFPVPLYFTHVWIHFRQLDE